MTQMFKINSKSNSFATDFTKIFKKIYSFKYYANNYSGICFYVLLFPRMPIMKYSEAVNTLFTGFISMSGSYEDVLLNHETTASPQTFVKKAINE